MEHSDETTPAGLLQLRLDPEQKLWLLRGADGSYLAAGHAEAGRVLLSWTTLSEMNVSRDLLEARAPTLFDTHQPVQRTVREAVETASRLGCRLRIDQYVIEGFRTTGSETPEEE